MSLGYWCSSNGVNAPWMHATASVRVLVVGIISGSSTLSGMTSSGSDTDVLSLRSGTDPPCSDWDKTVSTTGSCSASTTMWSLECEDGVGSSSPRLLPVWLISILWRICRWTWVYLTLLSHRVQVGVVTCIHRSNVPIPWLSHLDINLAWSWCHRPRSILVSGWGGYLLLCDTLQGLELNQSIEDCRRRDCHLVSLSTRYWTSLIGSWRLISRMWLVKVVFNLVITMVDDQSSFVVLSWLPCIYNSPRLITCEWKCI